MTATIDQVYSSARSLALPDLGVLVTRLLGELSTALRSTTDDELTALADAREAEMDRDPAATISHDDMLGFIQSRRR
ncbi:MAG: hypothetical protein JNN17_10420 [Verrucomicrobiaceae bacterium]|nr:hypothetical protein [Verrucomicrobiaceae bacterium]